MLKKLCVCCSAQGFFVALTVAVLLPVLTGMLISEPWIAGLGRGASMVRTPSGDRQDVIFSESTPGGRLQHNRLVSLHLRFKNSEKYQKWFSPTGPTLSLFSRYFFILPIKCASSASQHLRVFPGETSGHEAVFILPLLVFACMQIRCERTIRKEETLMRSPSFLSDSSKQQRLH